MKKIGFFTLLTLIFSANILNAAYIDEYPEAYKWAFSKGITTMTSIEKANMYGEITRIELSKMISNYAINVLKKNPDTSKKCEFSDVSDKLNKGYDSGVTHACQLGLMGQGITKFRPNDKVTRTEFGTILSRLLYENTYNGGTPYYIRHINNLNIRGIMTNIKNPEKVNESRGNVMVMLKRSEELGDYKTPTFEELDDDAFQCYECYLDGCIFEGIPKKGFIISYKDGYIGYDWQFSDINYRGHIYGGTYGLALTYRKVDDPCKIVYETSNIYFYEPSNFENLGCILYYGFTQKKLENFNSKEKNEGKCKNDIEKYFYKLITRKEKEENFTSWMKAFLENINNNSNSSWNSKFSDCSWNIVGNENLYENLDENFYGNESIKDFDADKFLSTHGNQDYYTDGVYEEEKNFVTNMEKISRFCAKEILKD